jgi:hypothetical protein
MFQECKLCMLEDLCVHTGWVLFRVWEWERSGAAIQFRDLRNQSCVRICVLPGCSIRMCTLLLVTVVLFIIIFVISQVKNMCTHFTLNDDVYNNAHHHQLFFHFTACRLLVVLYFASAQLVKEWKMNQELKSYYVVCVFVRCKFERKWWMLEEINKFSKHYRWHERCHEWRTFGS